MILNGTTALSNELMRKNITAMSTAIAVSVRCEATNSTDPIKTRYNFVSLALLSILFKRFISCYLFL
nr:MAG TPA: hypothetical protein [Caudoviricetes sp.]